MRRKHFYFGIGMLAVILSLGFIYQADPKQESTSAAQELNLKKLNEEVRKLQEETAALQNSNAFFDRTNKIATAWLAAVGSVILGLLIFRAGRSLNRTQEQKLQQDLTITAQRHQLESRKIEQDLNGGRDMHELQTKKMLQDKKLAREKQMLEVFHDLGDDKARIRIGAVAILVQRMSSSKKDGSDPQELQEIPTMVSVLISMTKQEDTEDIQKYIADGIAASLGAIVEDGLAQPESDKSPLAKYDFQGAKLKNAWWRRIDARGVDFYKANLERAGLREAFLSGAVLKNTFLMDATLVKADLREADLQGAHLNAARLRGADLTNAKLQGADLTNADLSDAILDGAILSGAILNGTIIKGTKFGAAELSNVNLSQTTADAGTDLSKVKRDARTVDPPPVGSGS